MEKRSSNKLLNGVVFLIAVAIFVMGAFMYIENKKENKKEKNDNIKEEVKEDAIKELDSLDVSKLISNYFNQDIPYIFKNIEMYGIDEKVKMELALLNTDEYTTEYKCSDLFEVSGVYGTYLMTPDSKSSWGCMDTDSLKSYKYDDVNKKYQKLFGSDLEMKKIGYAGDPSFDYSDKTDSFVILKPAFNDSFLKEYYFYDIKDYKQDDDLLEVTISYLKYSLVDLNKYSVTLNLDTKETFESVDEIENYFNENKDNALNLTLKFKYTDDHFILVD